MSDYFVIPGISGRLIVGSGLDIPSHRTFQMDVRPVHPPYTAAQYEFVENPGDEEEIPSAEDLDRRAAALKWYMAKSQEAGSVFYIFSPPRAWEMAAMCLMARYGWTKPSCGTILSELAGEELNLDAAEAGYKAWLERGQ